MSLENQVIEIFAGTQGFSDQIPLDRMRAWEIDLLRFMQSSHPEIGTTIAENKRILPETETALREALSAFTSSWLG